MHFEPRLWTFTEGVRLRILWAVLIGLAAVGLGVARLGLLGWLIGEVFAGRDIEALALPIALVAVVMGLRGAFEHWRTMVAHETAARVQKRLRRRIYDQIAALGPGAVGRERSGALSLSLIDGVEQLETYFGQFLPQFLIALLTPILIFAAVAFLDLPVAAVMLAFALVALFAPALWHRFDVKNALGQQKAYAAFAAEFLDSIQGFRPSRPSGRARRGPTGSKTGRASSRGARCGCSAPTCSRAASRTARSPAARRRRWPSAPSASRRARWT